MYASLSFRNETPITLKEVPHYAPKRCGRKLHYSTVFRWATKGVRGRILPTFLVGGIRFTTVEALEWFLEGASVCRGIAPATDDLNAVNQALDEAGL